MKWFCKHVQKKHILYAVATLLFAGIGVSVIPPAVQSVSAVLTAQETRKLPIYCVQTDEKKVAISFDAAWGADDTDELLRILAENDVHATFFLCGYWVEKYPDEVQKIADAGHDLGNHSATHPHMSQISKADIAKELQNCHTAVKELTGIDMHLFRPPFGEYTNDVIETATENGYYTIQWDIDTLEIKIIYFISFILSICIIFHKSPLLLDTKHLASPQKLTYPPLTGVSFYSIITLYITKYEVYKKRIFYEKTQTTIYRT